MQLRRHHPRHPPRCRCPQPWAPPPPCQLRQPRCPGRAGCAQPQLPACAAAPRAQRERAPWEGEGRQAWQQQQQLLVLLLL